MNDVTKIIEAMEEYDKQLTGKSFSAVNLRKYFEPIFKEKGYRNYFSENIERILIVFDGGVGDFIMFSPVLREIKRIYCRDKIILLIPHFVENIAETCPYIDGLLIDKYRHKFFTKADAFKLYLNSGIAEKLLSYNFGIAFNFGISDNAAILCYMSGARERILSYDTILGAAVDKEAPIVTAKELSTVLVRAQFKSRHSVDHYLGVLDGMLHLPIRKRDIEIWFTQTDLKIARSMFSVDVNNVIVVLGLGGMDKKKHWPVERYVELAKRIISREKNIQFVIVGGSKEKYAAEKIEKVLPKSKCCNLAGKLTYRQTAAVMSYCHMYIGNDTGSMHIAAALKMPVLAVFCCPEDHRPETLTTVERVFPYGVPAVVVRPDKRLPECIPSDGSFDVSGCMQDKPHCIMQVSVDDMWQGYCALLEMIKMI